MKSFLSEASLVIPLFNNEKTAVLQLKECEKVMKSICAKYEIIVCDDKSTDGSRSILKKHFMYNRCFKLIFNKQNQGIAKTILNLYKTAGYAYIVLFSVDGDWNPQDIKKLLLFADKNQADIVIGKRTYSDYSFYRKIVSFFYNFLPYILFQTRTIDAGSIKVIKRELIHSFPLVSKSVFFEAEMIIRAAKNGKKIASVPIDFSKRIKRKSSGGNLKLVVSSLRDIVFLRLRM